MTELNHLFEKNRQWAEAQWKKNPKIFTELSEKQEPKYLWIGCSDSRIPANEIIGLEPGELFVHRNVANMFPHTDFNCLSVLQYGIEYLGIQHVIVCGHYGCGGIAAAMKGTQFGLIDNWLRNIRDVYFREKEELDHIQLYDLRYKRLVELNVLHQVLNVCHTTIVQNAWAKGRSLSIHGWVYDVSTGLVKDTRCHISSLDQIDEAYRTFRVHY